MTPLSIRDAITVFRMAQESRDATDAERARCAAAVNDLELALRYPEVRAALHDRPRTKAPRGAEEE